MQVLTKLLKAEDLEQLPQSDSHVELIEGEVIIMPPAGHEHGEISLNIGSLLREFLRKHKRGKAYAAETGFILSRDPDTVRAPDAAFVASERAASQARKEGFFDGAPDLAVEVISPTDTDEDVEAKVLDYLRSGTRMVWVIRPRTRTVTVYRSLSNIRLLTEGDTLDGDDVLPGFSTAVKDIFGE
jgi:Uma2 family endonuclease